MGATQVKGMRPIPQPDIGKLPGGRESLRGVPTREVPLPTAPVALQRQPGDIWFDFEDEAPPEEAFLPYGSDHPTQKEAVLYWEPYQPGTELMPWPRVTPIVSTVEGLWVCLCDAQQEAVRDYLKDLTGGDPDKMKVTDTDRQLMAQGKYIRCGTCRFQTTSVDAWDAHVDKWQHQSTRRR